MSTPGPSLPKPQLSDPIGRPPNDFTFALPGRSPLHRRRRRRLHAPRRLGRLRLVAEAVRLSVGVVVDGLQLLQGLGRRLGRWKDPEVLQQD